MDHNSAIENHTAERYLMGELNEAERDAYEEHFFCCAACADEIKSANEFMESARQVVQDELKSQIYSHAAHRSIWGSWLNWRSMLQPIPAMACVLLVAVTGFTGYQNRVTIPRLAQMASSVQVIPVPTFVLRNARAETPVVTARRDSSFGLPFEIPPANYASYQVSVLPQANAKRLLSKSISAEEAKKRLAMVVPVGKLAPGNYFLLIEGPDGKGEVDRIPFELKFQD